MFSAGAICSKSVETFEISKHILRLNSILKSYYLSKSTNVLVIFKGRRNSLFHYLNITIPTPTSLQFSRSEHSLLSSTASRFSNYEFEYCWYSFIHYHNIHKIRQFNAKYKCYCKCITLWNLVTYRIFVWCFNPYFLRLMLPNCALVGLQWFTLSYEQEQILSARFLSTIPQAFVWQQTHMAWCGSLWFFSGILLQSEKTFKAEQLLEVNFLAV